MSSVADVIVIGGGVTGVSVAWHLARAGAGRVVILERRFLAAGGTGRSVGIIRQLYPTPETMMMVRRSLEVYRRFEEVVGGPSGYVGCGALIGVGPTLRPALERALALQRRLGITAEVLDPAEVRRIEPRLDPTGLEAVVYEPDSGYADPAGVTQSYATAARSLGVRIEQETEVTAFVRAGERVLGVLTQRGERIEAPVVVNAAGLWAGGVARLAGLELPLVIGRHPVFILERDPAFGPPHPVYLDLARGVYLRPETGNLTLTGSLTEDESRHPVDPEALGAPVGLDEATEALARASRALPPLAEARYRQGYAGAFDITPDWMPILDAAPVEGLWIAAGMSGHGFKLAPAVGELMCALITGARPPVDPGPFRFQRFETAAAPSGTFVSSYLR